jgi:peptide subunit release factor 1 (eRF1)
VAGKVGVWIDRRQAVVVRLDGDRAEIETVDSDLEKRTRMAGGSRSTTGWGPQDIASETRRDRRFAKHVQEYYDRVLASIGDAGAIFVFGPGEAKNELVAAASRSSRHQEASTEIGASDKLTEPQIVAHVKEHFGVRTRGSGSRPPA